MRRLALLLLLALSCLPIHAQDVTPDMKSLANDLYNSLNKGNQKEAESLADRYLALCTSDDLRYGPFYAEAKHVKARAAAANGDYALAEKEIDRHEENNIAVTGSDLCAWSGCFSVGSECADIYPLT